MGFISDAEAMRVAMKVLLPDEYKEFAASLQMLRELQQTIAEGRPSPFCTYNDLKENLNWSALAAEIHAGVVEDYLQTIIPAAERGL